MIKKSFLIMFFLVGISLSAIILYGCAETRYSVTSYYYPDWTSDGKIICEKKVDNYRSGGGWPSFGGASLLSTNYYITTMSEEGTQELNIKEINRVSKTVASPTGNHIAYTDGNYIKIITSAGQDVYSINCKYSDFDYDWGNNGDKLIYNIYDFSSGINTYKMFMVAIDGGNETQILTKSSSPSWRYGNQIVVNSPLTTESSRTVAINSSTLSEEAAYLRVIGGQFNISNANTNEVIYKSDSGINKFFLDSPSSDPVLLNTVTQVNNIHLSPNAQKIIGSGSGSDLGKEIWILNIDGSGMKQLK